MSENMKKVTIKFDLSDPEDQEKWKSLEHLQGRVNRYTALRRTGKSDLLKLFMGPISDKNWIQFCRKGLTHEERLNIWKTSYQVSTGENIDLMKFVVEVLPGLKDKQREELEVQYFSQNEDQNHVRTDQ